ncbi:EF-hand domain-containing protein [Streptacidiphilus sp. P02-A3a]|uniref:EF-hand domain-containing protein n=1 Tax=Streptacidiphilus sp. P02-A3a TaxID=2704468 RepID=UPI0015FA2211|nr:EF-hand domain-containing protein [Streptacidiphilus sp. P02-A3a]QMU71390.1 EF-hand domain-containing protein [Streptacidiphilus sp. P02-A3a]
MGGVFDLADVNGRGELGGEHVEELVEQLAGAFGVAPGSPEHTALKAATSRLWQVLLQDLGLGDKDKVGREHYVAHYSAAADSAVRQSLTQLTDLLFELFDVDGDGKISPSEFERYHRAWDVPADRIQLTFEQLDSGGTGFLSREQLSEYLGGFILGNHG